MDYMKRVCNHCGCEVKPEPDGKKMNEEYPYVCPECDENLFGIETHMDIPNMPTETAEKHNVVAACCCRWCDYSSAVQDAHRDTVRICKRHGNVRTCDCDTCDDCETGGANAEKGDAK